MKEFVITEQLNGWTVTTELLLPSGEFKKVSYVLDDYVQEHEPFPDGYRIGTAVKALEEWVEAQYGTLEVPLHNKPEDD